MPQNPDVAFVACIEPGALERQALLLFESLRAWGGRFARHPVYALAPRAGLGVGRATRRRLEALDVVYIDKVLNTECVAYGSANRVAAAAHIEATTQHEILVILDSDTIFLREPGAFALPADVDVAVRPVDVKGMCTSGPADPFDAYWRALCELGGVSYDDVPWARTYVDDVRAKASYNGGLVVARTERRILARWADIFFASVRRGLRPYPEAPELMASVGPVAPAAGRMWGSNQAALSLAIWSATTRVGVLEPAYNYPLHLHAALGDRAIRDFNRLIHVHYHWLFASKAEASEPLLAPASNLEPSRLAWVRARTPLKAPGGLGAFLGNLFAARSV